MKIGVIGLGFMGATHIKAFSGIDGVTLGAVSATNPRTLEGDLSGVGGNIGNAAARYDFANVRKYPDWHELIRDADLDAVDICLPTDLHVPVTLAALEVGKDVLCEKPMALYAAECDRMLEAARASQKILMIGQVLRFWPDYRYLRSFVTGNEYGRVRTATFVRRSALPDWSSWLPNRSRSGGALLDLLVHDIDQALALFGAPAKIAAKSLGDVDTVSATFIYPGGPEVRIQGGWFPAGTPFAMGFQVRAEHAELELTPSGLKLNDESGKSQDIKSEGPDGYQAEVAYFVSCCRERSYPHECPPEASARAVKVALLMNESRSLGGKQIECAL